MGKKAMPDKMPTDKPSDAGSGQDMCPGCDCPKTMWASPTQMQPMKCGNPQCPMYGK